MYIPFWYWCFEVEYSTPLERIVYRSTGPPKSELKVNLLREDECSIVETLLFALSLRRGQVVFLSVYVDKATLRLWPVAQKQTQTQKKPLSAPQPDNDRSLESKSFANSLKFAGKFSKRIQLKKARCTNRGSSVFCG